MQFLHQMSPSVTNMIRMDHTHVQSAIRQFEASDSDRVKKGLADNVCVALEIHSQLEEEIFYPAMRQFSDSDALRKSGPEHNEMRELVSRLRAMEPSNPAFDETFHSLARVVMHHIADEETILLPAAERLIPDKLGELGAQMMKRRLELSSARGGEIAGSMARSMSMGTVFAAGSAMLAGAHLLASHRPASRSWVSRMWR